MSFRIAFATLLATLVACGPGPDPSGGEVPPVTLELTRLYDLGPECTNPGAVVAAAPLAWVACGGTFEANDAAVARVELDTGAVTTTTLDAGPGVIALSDTSVVVGDMATGRLFLLDETGALRHALADAPLPCPSDAGAGILNFVSGLALDGEVGVLSCFATDEVVDFSVAGGAFVETGRRGVGDGPGALEAWGGGHVVLDGLSGTASFLPGTGAATRARWLLGDAPNDLFVEGASAHVVNSLSNTVQSLDLETGETTFELHLGDSTNPWSLAPVVGGRALVSLFLTGEVVAVDFEAGGIAGTFALPEGDTLSPTGSAAPLPRPQGLDTVSETDVVVTLPTLDRAYAPAGPGHLARIGVTP